MEGWISIHRKIQNSDIWNGEPFSRGQAWVDLLLLASHKETRFVIDGNIINLKPGEFITSKRKLGERWKWSRTKVDTYFKLLKANEMISYNSDTKKTRVTIINWGFYQGMSDTEMTPKSTINNNITTLNKYIDKRAECYDRVESYLEMRKLRK